MISGALTKDGGVPHFSPPRLLIIGAGARGNAYARAVTESTSGVVVSVAEPVQFKREALGKKYIWRDNPRQEDQEFNGWEEYLQYELSRRERERAGERVLPGIDGVFVCTLDQQHADIVTGLAPLGLHMMSEKPLATTLDDCLRIYRSLCPAEPTQPTAIFSVGHVLRYSPHNMLLRKLVLEDGVIGDIVSIEHTEPVGWWHFSHSFVR
jgi:predicted dehydrogenase